MNNTKETIKLLLKSFIYNSVPSLPECVDFRKIYALAKQQHIDGILGYVITQYNLCEDKKVEAMFLNSYLSAITVNTNQIEKFEKLLSTLNSNNIDVIVFKGAAIRSIYPIAELRSFADVDLVIRKSDRTTSHQLMLDLLYECTVDYGLVYGYKKGIEYYELHESLINEDILHGDALDTYFNNPWNYAIKIRDGLYEFDDNFHLLYLIAHIAKHIHFGGAGIRMYLDVALFIKEKHNTINFDELITVAKELSLDKFVCTVFSAVALWFGVDIPQDILNMYPTDSATLNLLFEFTIDKGIFGNSADSNSEAKIQIMSKKGKKYPKLSAIIDLALPSIDSMKLKYTYLEKSPFLLPIAWMHRIVTNLGKLGSKKRKIQNIMNTDISTVNNRSKLLEDIGLQEKPEQ